MSLHNLSIAARRIAFAMPVSAIALAAMPARADTPTIKQMNVNGADLTYQEQGQGVPVVFVHGAITDYRVWNGERDAIASGHHFVALNLRYYGTAPWPDDGRAFSFVQEAEDIAGFIKELNEGPVDLVSWSMSGPLALLVAIQHPGLVHRMFLYEPSADSFVADPIQAKAAMEANTIMSAPVNAAAKEGGPMAVVKTLPGAVNGQPDFFYTLPPDGQAILLDNARTVPLMFAHWPPPRVTCEQLGQLKLPVTVARGEDTTPYYKITSNAAAACIGGARLVVIANARHLAPMQDAPAMTAAILDFLAR